MRVMKLIALASCFLWLQACSESATDKELRTLVKKQAMNGEFIADLPIVNTDKAIVSLGGQLFFSPDLSLDGSVSCASCHHPSKAGADGIALPIGIGGGVSSNVGEQRIVAAAKDGDSHIIEGLIPRNSPTVFNSSLYKINLFWDGRAQYANANTADKTVQTGFGISPLVPTPYEQKSLLQTQARMPISSLFEMKGNLETNKNNHEIEQQIVKFLREQPAWCKKFETTFQQNSCDKAITLASLTQALAEYQATLLFTNSPFERYLKGDNSQITQQQKMGALLFFKSKEEGGLGCASCHSGKNFTNEQFYNIGIYASGRGSNENGWDFGRYNVNPNAEKFSYRTPNLLNIEKTAPYLHNGTAKTLEQAIAMHLTEKPKNIMLDIKKLEGIDYDAINNVINKSYKNNTEVTNLLPTIISKKQMKSVVEFLDSLTDDCVASEQCMKKQEIDIIESPRKKIINTIKNKQQQRTVNQITITPPVIRCQKSNANTKNNKSDLYFEAKNKDIGLIHNRSVGLVYMGWLLDVVNYGGVSVTDVNNDCLDDIVFDAGGNGLLLYIQEPNGKFKNQSFPIESSGSMITPLLVDADGDYQYDLFVGTSGKGIAKIQYDFMHKNDPYLFESLTGPVINASFADINNDGKLDIALAFWRSYKSLSQPHLWMGDGNGNFSAFDHTLAMRSSLDNITNTKSDLIRRPHQTTLSESDLTFTPNFVDIDGDDDSDLVLASDFNRSQILRNDGNTFTDITNKEQIDDNNGMGAALADFNNTQKMDWYVTSIYRKNEAGRTGNHLYRNNGKGGFSKDTQSAPLALENEWSWGTCTADFNNDGYMDIFYISGYGELLTTAKYENTTQQKASDEFQESYRYFANTHPRMLINDKKGGFIDESKKRGFDKPMVGRGVACFDYQQDGDIDIIINPLEGAPKLYVNQLHNNQHWLSLRLVGLPGNTEAFGTKVTLFTQSKKQYREVRFENNYLSRNPAQLHFGLGDETKIDKIEIHYPKPHEKTVILQQPTIDQLHIIYQEP